MAISAISARTEHEELCQLTQNWHARSGSVLEINQRTSFSVSSAPSHAVGLEGRWLVPRVMIDNFGSDGGVEPAKPESRKT
jgi:hypothetical protein